MCPVRNVTYVSGRSQLAKFDKGPLYQRAFRFAEGAPHPKSVSRRRDAGLLHVPDRRYTQLDTTTPVIPQCSTSNAKIVSNKNRRKKFLLKLIFV
jgi:hypothetical protein